MPNEVNTNRFTASYRDYGGKVTSFAVNTLALADNAAYVAAVTAFEDAIDAMTLGVQQNRVSQLYEELSSAPAGSPGAQRGSEDASALHRRCDREGI